jgi:putative DNA primase/helicase
MNAILSNEELDALNEAAPPCILSRSEPLRSAREFVERRFTAEGLKTLLYWQGDFYRWTGASYAALTPDDARAALYGFLDEAIAVNADGEPLPFSPNRRAVDDVLDALKAVANLGGGKSAPCWLAGEAAPASEFISLNNGLLHLPTGELHHATPNYFGLNALDFAHDPRATHPARWLAFLRELWPSDQQSIDTLQEVFGLLLTHDTSQQKIFLIVGPKRSGKGTIARVLIRLLGQNNVAGPTLASLGQNFGLSTLIGKQVAIISDARLGHKADHAAIAERLLAISGEDALSVPRKFKEDFTARLPVRFLILTNELPKLADASGALVSRFIMLNLSQSFYGREDNELTDKLCAELPAILNWSIEGWRRLKSRGRLIQPNSAQEALRELEDLASPIGAFIRERCDVSPAASIECGELFKAWQAWCEEQGREHPGTVQSFGRDLRAAIAGLSVTQHRTDFARERRYQRVKLKEWHAVTRDPEDCTRKETSNTYIHNAVDRVPLRAKCGDCVHFRENERFPDAVGTCKLSAWIVGSPALTPDADRECGAFESMP